jgi:serine/threonine-protein kinase HipA
VKATSFEVFLNDTSTGWLASDEEGRVSFRFSDSYRARAVRPVLSQSFEDNLDRVYWGRRAGELPAFFANVLPEGRFREVLERSLGLEDTDDLALLAAVAEDLPGAVRVGASSEPAPFGAPDESGTEANGNGREQIEFRFSLAGVQLKFSMVQQNGKLALPAHGGAGEWIVKVGATEYPSLAENEFSIMTWAKRAGFDVPEIELRPADRVEAIRKYAPEGSRVLVIRRFDRASGHRIHQEDFMQVFGWAPSGDRKYKGTYESLASVVFALLGNEGYEELLRRLALVIASGNNDAHLKNWSLLYRDGVTPSLAPIYDQVATVAWPRLDREHALKLSGARDFYRVNVDSVRRLARKLQVNTDRSIEVVRETLANLRAAWPRVLHDTPLPDDHIAAVVEHWGRVPLLREIGQLETRKSATMR